MADTHECIHCHKKREGRFTRKHTGFATVRARAAGPIVPNWWCWVCLPPGEGKDEDENMARTQAGMPPVTVDSRALGKVKQEGTALLAQVGDLSEMVVETPEQYQQADVLLSKVQGSRKTWAGIYGNIYERVLKPMRQALEGGYAINREIDGPLEKAEKSIKNAMKVFKVEEARQKQLEDRERQEREDTIAEEIERKRLAEEQAKTPQMRGKLAVQREKLEEKLADTIAETPTVVEADHSTTRWIPTPVVSNYAMCLVTIAEENIMDVKFMEDLKSFLGRTFKADPGVVRGMAGVTVENLPQIVGRR